MDTITPSDESLAPGARLERVGSLAIRRSTPADNEALLHLTRSCPMRGTISLAIERDPDFFALTRARGEGRTYVAEAGGRVVGCGSVCHRPAYVLGRETEIGYVADLRVLPAFRRMGVARRIVEAIAEAESAAPAAPYIASAAAGNRSVERMIRGLAFTTPPTPIGRFTSYQLWGLVRGSRRSGGNAGVEPAEGDELRDFLDAFHRTRTLAPVFAGKGLRNLLDVSPGMDLGSYRVARRGGRIVAALATWDASTVKHTRVVGLPRHLEWPGRLSRALSFLPARRLPVPGDLLRHVYIRHAAWSPGELPALRGLVREVVAELAGSAVSFALFTCPDGDPAASCVRGLLRTRYRYTLFAGTNAPEYAPRLGALRHARLYDDPALS